MKPVRLLPGTTKAQWLVWISRQYIWLAILAEFIYLIPYGRTVEGSLGRTIANWGLGFAVGAIIIGGLALKQWVVKPYLRHLQRYELEFYHPPTGEQNPQVQAALEQRLSQLAVAISEGINRANQRNLPRGEVDRLVRHRDVDMAAFAEIRAAAEYFGYAVKQSWRDYLHVGEKILPMTPRSA